MSILKDLESISKLRKEIKIYEQRLQTCYSKAGDYVGDSVLDYSAGKGRPLKIQGYAAVSFSTADKLSEIIKKRQDRLGEVILSIERYIDTVDDTIVRQIIELRFIDGWDWKKVARYIYGSPCEDRPRKHYDNYFKNIFLESPKFKQE